MENNIGYLYVDAMCTVDTYFCGMRSCMKKRRTGNTIKSSVTAAISREGCRSARTANTSK